MRWSSLFALAALFLASDAAYCQTNVDAAGDPLPAGAMKRFGTARLRHGSRIMALAYAPSGRMLAAAGGDDPVRLWDVDTGQQIRTLNETWVTTLAFSPRGSVLATAGAFKTIRLWEVATGKDYVKLEGHTAPIKVLIISPDGSMLASGSQDGAVILWELLTGKIITQFKGHTGEINALAFSADNTRLASAGGDRSIRVWDCDNAKPVSAVDGHCEVAALVFAADGKTLVSGGDDNLLRLWNAADGTLTRTLKGHTGAILSLLRSKSGNVISGARDGSIRVWDQDRQLLTIKRDLGDSDALAITKDGQFLACGGINNTVRIFKAVGGQEVLPGVGPGAAVAAVALAPNGKWLVSANTTGELHLWEADTGKEIRHWSCPTAGDVVLAFAPDSRTIVSANGQDALRFWDPLTGKEIKHLPGDPDDPIQCLAYSSDGSKLAAGHRLGKVDLWDLAEQKIIRQLKCAGPVNALAFNGDGSVVAAGGLTKIELFDTSTGREMRQGAGKTAAPPSTLPAVAALAFAPDGKTLAAACYDGVVRLVDCITLKEIRGLRGHGNVAYALAFSGDGRVLASASFDKTVRLWETFSGLQIALYNGHAGPVTALGFPKDGRKIYTGGADTSILLWDATGLAKEGALPGLALGPAELKSAWLDLASEEAPRGYRALWSVIAAAKEGIPFVGGQLYLLDPVRVDKLFADLNSEQYKVRTEATKELERYGIWMKGRMLTLHKNPPTLEVQRRIDQMLSKLDLPGSLSLEQERLRVRRVMLALEQVGSAEAIAFLEKLTIGAPEPELQQEARGSLERLGHGNKTVR